MNSFISYVLLGLSLSAPIGPVNAAQLDKGIRGGFFHAWFVGIGALAADILYMLLVYFGVVHFLNTPFMKTFLWLFGFFILTYTGIDSLKQAGNIHLNEMRGGEPLMKSLLFGFMMSVSNPLSILFWLGIYGSVLAQAASAAGTQELIVNSCAIISGLIVWDLAMAGFASVFRRFLTDRILVTISVISGISLIGFGLYFGYEAALLLLERL
ncbi:LysE family transporter [Paenibacillus sp. FSL R5-0527]|uniref:LysE family transporter n=1 Tax=Paenibacillus TaxID=44249 RepID=UPI000979F077|nr:LysE family transporter [Paenibacillus macerans]MEC0328783.1 LysE family transporter [Paenibacillus macerans]OMG47943.1 amino acid transporter [Paenibacillus macerans]GBK65348.1 amino acid transporter [Paenibacillus macerans]GBK71672.1 amino acid transporter [Paenibacillus macerans]